MVYFVIDDMTNPQELNHVLGTLLDSRSFYSDVKIEIVTGEIPVTISSSDIVFICGYKAAAGYEHKEYKSTVNHSQWLESGTRVVHLNSIDGLLDNPNSCLDFVNQLTFTVNHRVSEPVSDIKTTLVHSPAGLVGMISDLTFYDHVVLDIESSGLNPLDDEMLCIALSGKDDHAYIVLPSVFNEPMFTKYLKNAAFVCHNGKFDAQFILHSLGVLIDVAHDTMLLHYVLDERRKTHGLKRLVTHLLGGHEYDSVLQQYLPKKNSSYSLVPKHILYKYAGLDVCFTLQLFRVLRAELNHNKAQIKSYRFLVSAADMFTKVEKNGVLFDSGSLESIEKELKDKLDATELNLYDLARSNRVDNFNPRSPKQVANLLYDIMKFPQIEGRTTKKEVLELLLNVDSKHAEFIQLLVANRQIQKVYGTYLVGEKGLKNNVDSDGKIRTNYNLHMVVTGRTSSSDPNLQNIVKPEKNPYSTYIRSLFIADEGYTLLAGDYSQAELRVAAVIAKETTMRDVWLSGADFHEETGFKVFGDRSKESRGKAKAINFGIVYGTSATGLSRNIGTSKREAQAMLDEYFLLNPKLKKYLDRRVRTGQMFYALEAITGRKRRFGYHTKAQEYKIRTQAMNFEVQSVASDICLQAMIDLQNEYDNTGIAKLVLNVHDDIVSMCKLEDVEEVSSIKQNIMINAAYKVLNSQFVPFEVDIRSGKNWGQL